MHHEKIIKFMKNKLRKHDFFTKQLMYINRKYSIMCREHHIKLHNKKTMLQ